jgi:hypothetical protein
LETIEDVLLYPKADLFHLTQLSSHDLDEWLCQISIHLCNQKQITIWGPATPEQTPWPSVTDKFSGFVACNASDLLSREWFLRLGDPAIDLYLGGGFMCPGIVDISGEGGSGKTLACLHLMVSVQQPISEGGLEGGMYFNRSYVTIHHLQFNLNFSFIRLHIYLHRI